MVNLFKMDKYEVIAVFIPAMLCSVLIIISFYPMIDFKTIMDLSEDSTKLFVSLGLSPFVCYGLIHFFMTLVQRFSKYVIEQPYFGKNNERMPTTLYLLHNEPFGDLLLAEQVRTKVKSDFGIELFSKKKETNNRSEAVRMILSATKRIKKHNQQTNNEMYNRRNRRYGQCRNIIGGCLISILVSLLALYIQYNNGLGITFPLISILIAVALEMFHIFMYKKLAEEFACDFFETYLNTK